MITPFRVLLGFGALFLSFMIWWSLSLNAIDRIMHSKCGFSCGYMIEQKNIFNPLDSLLVTTSNHFPLDYFFFTIMVSYIFICVLYGVTRFGFNYLCLRSYEIKRGETMPQALTVWAFIINLLIMVLCSQLMAFCPSYTTFGA